jgi:diguanylate cyclase (GGDEF)-like protein/PAS domain S-box-containing protein
MGSDQEGDVLDAREGHAHLGRAEAIVGSAAFAVNRFAGARSWESAVPEVLTCLGAAGAVSRVYVFENSMLPDGRLAMSQRFEWAAPGIGRTMADPDNQNFPYDRGYEEYGRVLGAGGVVVATAATAPEEIALDLAEEDIRSMVLVPVFAGGEWWGYVGFDDCLTDRRWTSLEIEALRASAGILGAAIYRERLDHELRRAESWLHSHVESIPAVTYIEYTDDENPLGYIDTFVSPQIEMLTGYTPAEWLRDPGRSMWPQLVHPDDREAVEELSAATSRTGEPFVAEYRLRTKGGEWAWIHDEAHLVSSEDAGPPYWHGVMVDITARKRAEEQVAFLAYHDSLTGLANRASFEHMLEPALARARRRRLAVAVLFLDLDDFKTVNDVLGHDAGDLLLKEVAERLTGVVRETDLLARQGGDEFLVLIPDLEADGRGALGGRDAALAVAESMAERIADVMWAPFDLAGREVATSASIGISIFPYDAEDGRALLKNSDAAMYESKSARHGGYAVYATPSARSAEQPSFTHRLRDAVRNERWVLHYQPIVDLADGTLAGAEALLRWRRPKGGLLAPKEFLPLAEEMGLLEIIGDWVLEEVCGEAAAWRDRGVDVPLSFNLSPRQLWQPDLAGRIGATLEAAGIEPPRLMVEVSEFTAATDPARTQRVLASLHEVGLAIALDDFGTGYSSPAQLRGLPLDVLKMDQPLVRDALRDPDVAAFGHAIIRFADALGMRSLAEGVETEEQRSHLVQHGCALGQGYLFCRPVSGAEVLDAFASRANSPPDSRAGVARRATQVDARARSSVVSSTPAGPSQRPPSPGR